MTKRRFRTAGFTLIELSIVLVIIGLIVGGVLVGKDLIEASRVRAVVTDIEQLKSAIYTFKNKYACLPGDCEQASQFLGAVYNGNGDKRYTLWQESSAAKNHLIAARLWKNDIEDSTSPFLEMASFNNQLVGMWLYTNSYQYGWNIPITQLYGNTINIGGWCGWNFWAGVVPAQMAHDIDLKIDDGKPSLGKVAGQRGGELGIFSANCADPNHFTCLAAGEYDIANRDNHCTMLFLW